METIRIDGIIGDWGNTIEEFKFRVEELNLQPDDQLKVIINSPGGSVFEGFAIYNYLVSLPNEIITEVEGLAASIATLIAFAAKKANTFISQISMFMIHKASVGVQGNSEELEKQADILKSIDETLISVYAARTGKTRNEIENLLSEETWLSADEAAKEGFFSNKNVINQVDAKAAAKAHQSQIDNHMNNKFKNLLNKFSNNGGNVEQPAQTPETPEVVETPTAETPETPESVETQTPETPEVVETPTAESETPETPEFVTVEAFNELANLVREVVETLANQEPIENQVKSAFAAQLKTLPTSQGNPRKKASNLNQPQGGYVPKHANFKARMKEIEEKTRRS